MASVCHYPNIYPHSFSCLQITLPETSILSFTFPRKKEKKLGNNTKICDTFNSSPVTSTGISTNDYLNIYNFKIPDLCIKRDIINLPNSKTLQRTLSHITNVKICLPCEQTFFSISIKTDTHTKKKLIFSTQEYMCVSIYISKSR